MVHGSIVCLHVDQLNTMSCTNTSPHTKHQDPGFSFNDFKTAKLTQHNAAYTNPDPPIQFKRNCMCLHKQQLPIPCPPDPHTPPFWTHQTDTHIDRSCYHLLENAMWTATCVSKMTNSPVKMLQLLWWQQLPIPNLWKNRLGMRLISQKSFT